MAKIILRKNEDIDTIAEQLKQSGITVDKHRLPDGTYRVYVRKENMAKFAEFMQQFNPPNYET